MCKKIIPGVFGLVILGSLLYAMEQPPSTFDIMVVNATKKDLPLKFATKYQRSWIRPKGYLYTTLVLGIGLDFPKGEIPSEENVKATPLKGGDYEYDITLKPALVFGTTQKASVIRDIQPEDTLYARGLTTSYKYTVPLDKARDLVHQKQAQQLEPGKSLVTIVVNPAAVGYNFKLNYKRVTSKK